MTKASSLALKKRIVMIKYKRMAGREDTRCTNASLALVFSNSGLAACKTLASIFLRHIGPKFVLMTRAGGGLRCSRQLARLLLQSDVQANADLKAARAQALSA